MSLVLLSKIAACLGFVSTTTLLIMTIVRPALGLKYVATSTLVAAALLGWVLLLTGLEALVWWMNGYIHSRDDGSPGQRRRFKPIKLLTSFHLEGSWEAGEFLRRLLRFLFLPASAAAAGTAGVLFLVKGDSVFLVATGYLLIYLLVILLLSFLAGLLYPVAGIDYL